MPSESRGVRKVLKGRWLSREQQVYPLTRFFLKKKSKIHFQFTHLEMDSQTTL